MCKYKIDVIVSARILQNSLKPVKLRLHLVAAIGVKANYTKIRVIGVVPMLFIARRSIIWKMKIFDKVIAVLLMISKYRIGWNMR